MTICHCYGLQPGDWVLTEEPPHDGEIDENPIDGQRHWLFGYLMRLQTTEGVGWNALLYLTGRAATLNTENQRLLFTRAHENDHSLPKAWRAPSLPSPQNRRAACSN
jgi:hypothetical protein